MTTNKLKVLAETRVAAGLIDAYRAILDEASTHDLIEGETSVLEMIDQLLSDVAGDAALIAGIDAVMADLAERKKRFKDRQERTRELLLYVMQSLELRSMERPAATLAVRVAPPRVIITDEAAIPQHLIRIKHEPNKALIADAIKAGEQVPGAELSNQPETLSLRFT
jgi:Siphovirus Gp157